MACRLLIRRFFGLYQERKISKQMALHHAASAAELAAQMEGVA